MPHVPAVVVVLVAVEVVEAIVVEPKGRSSSWRGLEPSTAGTRPWPGPVIGSWGRLRGQRSVVVRPRR